ncbi:hypothetical protein M885DRAFT_529521 [Pelagophyceae sp. CCMP2097]|nr:hypothetical protein M885DRAFT_529521 [Pelagophyceae sp. CCMP2097]
MRAAAGGGSARFAWLWLLLLGQIAAKVDTSNQNALRRFVVITQPRSGSTWFVKFSERFAQCPGMVTDGEVLHPAAMKKRSPSLLGKVVTDPSFADYIKYVKGTFERLKRGLGWRGEVAAEVWSDGEAAVFEEFSPVRAVGFKLMYSQLPSNGPGAPVADSGMMRNVTLKAFLKYCAVSDIAIIHLHRLNHLERFISLSTIKGNDTNATYHDAGGLPTATSRRSNGATPKLRLDANAAELFVRVQLRQNRHLQHFLDVYCQKFNATCHTVAYEHLVGPTAEDYFAAVRRKIGVEACTEKASANGPSQWLPCAERVENWDQVSRYKGLAGSVCVEMCSNGNIIPQWSSDVAATEDAKKTDAYDDGKLLRVENALGGYANRNNRRPAAFAAAQRKGEPPPGDAGFFGPFTANFGSAREPRKEAKPAAPQGRVRVRRKRTRKPPPK